MQPETTNESETKMTEERRAFLARAGKLAVTAPAAAALLLAASSQNARAAYVG